MGYWDLSQIDCLENKILTYSYKLYLEFYYINKESMLYNTLQKRGLCLAKLLQNLTKNINLLEFLHYKNLANFNVFCWVIS